MLQEGNGCWLCWKKHHRKACPVVGRLSVSVETAGHKDVCLALHDQERFDLKVKIPLERSRVAKKQEEGFLRVWDTLEGPLDMSSIPLYSDSLLKHWSFISAPRPNGCSDADTSMFKAVTAAKEEHLGNNPMISKCGRKD